jgi:hypothetical protein
MPWEYDPSADQVRDERGRLLKGEKAAEYKQRLAEQQAAEKEEYEKTRTVMTWKEDKEMGSRGVNDTPAMHARMGTLERPGLLRSALATRFCALECIHF